MTYRQLQVFLSVVRLGSIVAAAEHVGLTQSAVSRLVSKLEKNVGFDLFRRVGRGLEPTASGLAFHREVERSFNGIDVLRQVANEIRLGYERRIRISCLPALSTSVFPGAVARFREMHPDVLVEVDTSTYGEMLIELEQGDIDLAVTFSIPTMNGVYVEPLAEADIMFAVNKAHPLASLSSVTAADVKDQELIGLLPHKVAPEQGGDADEIVETASKQRLWCHTSATRYACIAASLVASLVEPFIAPQFAPLGVVTLPFEPQSKLEYCFAIPDEHQCSAISIDFRSAFKQSMVEFAELHGLPIRTA